MCVKSLSFCIIFYNYSLYKHGFCVIVKIWVGFGKIHEFFIELEIWNFQKVSWNFGKFQKVSRNFEKTQRFHEILKVSRNVEKTQRFHEILEKLKGFTKFWYRETFGFFLNFVKPLVFLKISWNLWVFPKFRETLWNFPKFRETLWKFPISWKIHRSCQIQSNFL